MESLTLKQLAAKLNLYTLEDMPQAYKAYYEERFKGRYEDSRTPAFDFVSGLQMYECDKFYQCKKETSQGVNYYVIEHVYVLVKRKDSDLVLLLSKNNKDKYYLHLYYSYHWKYHGIEYHLRNKATEHLKEPSHIGVWTVNKLSAWVDYCKAQYEALETLYAQVNDKNTEIEKQIQAFIKSLSGAKVSTYGTTTEVDTKLFEIRFDHNKGQNYLSTKVTFRGTLADITKISNL